MGDGIRHCKDDDIQWQRFVQQSECNISIIQPTLDRASIVVGIQGTPYVKLIEMPPFPAHNLDATSPATISVSINFSRLTCVTSFDYVCGVDDF